MRRTRQNVESIRSPPRSLSSSMRGHLPGPEPKKVIYLASERRARLMTATTTSSNNNERQRQRMKQSKWRQNIQRKSINVQLAWTNASLPLSMESSAVSQVSRSVEQQLPLSLPLQFVASGTLYILQRERQGETQRTTRSLSSSHTAPRQVFVLSFVTHTACDTQQQQQQQHTTKNCSNL